MQLNQWEIASKPFLDDYGIPLPSRGNGSAYIPDGYHNKFAALTLVETTQMSYKELLNLYYPEFVELSLLAKAKSWIEPTKSKRDKEQEEHRRRIRGY